MTYHKIHPITTYNSVVFNIGTGLSSLCHSLVLEHVITPKRNPAPISSHTQCHFPGPRGTPVFLWLCQHVAGLLGLAKRCVHVVTLPRNPGFSLMAGMQCFLLKQISFNLLTAFCFSEGGVICSSYQLPTEGGHTGHLETQGQFSPKAWESFCGWFSDLGNFSPLSSLQSHGAPFSFLPD